MIGWRAALNPMLSTMRWPLRMRRWGWLWSFLKSISAIDSYQTRSAILFANETWDARFKRQDWHWNWRSWILEIQICPWLTTKVCHSLVSQSEKSSISYSRRAALDESKVTSAHQVQYGPDVQLHDVHYFCRQKRRLFVILKFLTTILPPWKVILEIQYAF